MENSKNNNVSEIKKKILSLVCLIVFSVAFVFSCMKNTLLIGKWLVGTFGLITYPLFLILSLISLALFLGLRYKRNIKSTIYSLIILTSLLFVIQAIATFGELDKVASSTSFKAYVDYSYSVKTTLVGGFGSIIIGGIATLLGAMGSIVVCVIALTISIGLLIDYENYGKFEDENIKKLSNRKLRNKVNDSDKNITDTGEPIYTFSSENSGEEIATIEAQPSELTETSSYGQSETDYNNFMSSGYSSGDVLGETTQQFENEPDEPESIYSPFRNNDEERNRAAREFMGGTFGGYQNPEPSQEPVTSFGEVNTNFDTVNLGDNESNITSFGETDTDIDIDADLQRLLGNNEPDILDEPDVQIDSSFESQKTETQAPFTFGNQSFANSNIGQQNQLYGQNFGGFESQVNTPSNNTFGFANNSVEDRNRGILSGVTQPTTLEKPIVEPIVMKEVRYNPPPLSLLRKPVPDNNNYAEEQNRKSKQLEEVLNSFNIPAKVVNIVRGPKITRFEMSVPLGVSVKKIPNYELDIQSSLAAKTVTIKAPIPGSQYVGIELENDTFTSVYERELLESPEFQNAKDPLPIAIGKDISGEIIVKSLAKMVHLLIAGSTGSGKSVFIHNIVLSLIYKYGPEDLRLVMVDPKKVEFGIYNGLPHLITPEVVLGTEKAINALKWCVKEMDRRYELMGKANYRNIEPYNKSDLVKSGQMEHLPYIVIIVDELAEIMLANKKESEYCIQRITQLARACGMHLILATQRPSVDVISGTIKNNMPSRIAFSLQTSIDSKTILGAVGAEKLLGQGDMIFAPTGTSATPRLQASYATDEEIQSVIDFDIKNNQANYSEDIETAFNTEQQADGGGDGQVVFANSAPAQDKVDEYFKVAVKTVMMNGTASISYLQRRLGIGYSRGAKIIDQMEERGYISQASGSKQRKVLITPEKFREDFGEDYTSL